MSENATDFYARFEGSSSQKIINGSASFENLIFFAKPLNINLELQFTSTLINEKTNYYSAKAAKYPFKINIALRSCIPGEIYDSKTASCILCPANTYSFNVKDKKCKECLSGTSCYGGSDVTVNTGYWRPNIFSEKVFKCRPFAGSCL